MHTYNTSNDNIDKTVTDNDIYKCTNIDNNYKINVSKDHRKSNNNEIKYLYQNDHKLYNNNDHKGLIVLLTTITLLMLCLCYD